MRTNKTLGFGLILALGAGCASSAVRGTVPSRVNHVAATRVSGPHAPAGQDFNVTMLSTLGSEISRVGQEFTARLDTPLMSAEGTELIPRGSIVHGRVAEVGWGPAPMLRLHFTTVETPRGEALLRAHLERVSSREIYSSGPRQPRNLSGPVYGTGIYNSFSDNPGIGYFQNTLGPVGGGPRPSMIYSRPRHVRVDAGAQLRLRLVEPVIPPGSTIMQ